MNPEASVEAYQSYLNKVGLKLERMSVKDLADTALSFYREVPADGLDESEDSDMLLYQWGVFDFGRGEHFKFDITRQFITAKGEDDDALSQFRITAYFVPTAEMRQLQASNRWCESKGELGEFEAFIRDSEAYRIAKNAILLKIEASWSYV
jgi:hypothetical protein